MIQISNSVPLELLRVWPSTTQERSATINWDTGVKLVGVGSNKRPYFSHAPRNRCSVAGVVHDVTGSWGTSVAMPPAGWAQNPKGLIDHTRRAVYFLEVVAREMGFFLRYRLELIRAAGLEPDPTGHQVIGREVVGIPPRVTLNRSFAYMLALGAIELPTLDIDVVDSGIPAKVTTYPF